MADPLSVIAGILAVVGASRKTFQGLQKAWELRHMDEDFLGLINEVTGLRTQLQAVETSLQQSTQKDLDNELLRDCIRNVASLSLQAKAVLGEIDKFVRHIESKNKGQWSAARIKPSKKRWLLQKSTLIRLTNMVRPIVHSLTTTTSVLRTVASDQKLSKLDNMVTRLTIQNIELLQNTAKAATTVEDNMPLETKLDYSISHAIGLEESTKCGNISTSRRSSIDSFHSAFSSSAESTRTILSITGTIGNDMCESFCPCQCHVSSHVRTPHWVKQFLGTMTFHGNGSILLNRRPCNKNCRRSGPTSIQFSYFAPAGTLLKSLNVIIFKAQSIHCLDFNICMPRVIPYNATVWSIIELGKLSNLKEMISQNAISPYDVNPSGRSLLYYAAIKGQNDIYRYLLSLKADPYFRDGSGIAANQPGVDRALSGTGLDRKVSSTAHAASYDLFINTETLNQQEFNFLHLIVLGLRNLSLELVLAQCLSHQSDVDAPDVNGRTPLIWAAWRGDVGSVELLLNSRAKINRVDHQGYSAIARAAKAGHLDCVRKLLRAGASIDISDDRGIQPIHHASSNKASGLPIVDDLLAAGAHPNAPSANGTPLHFAANRGSTGIVKSLLLAGADVDTQDLDGDSPAMVSLLCWNQSTFSYLMRAGAKLNHVRKTGENIVHLVTWSGSTEIWSEMTKYVNSERMSGVDIGALHNGHGLKHCYEYCRSLWYVGERENKEEEEMKFQRMIEAFKNKAVS